MSLLDWGILICTLGFIVIYGSWKTRKNKDIKGFLKGGNEANWATIGLSVMATQASAITFLSTPGQAYESGMGFVQFYFGLPIAMVILCSTVIPIYYKLKVYTAYEYLEGRFDLKTRLLTAFLFLLQRGLAAGITIYAPAIILSTVLGWDLNLTNIVVGVLVIIYTVAGGTKAVSLTQKWQMAVIMGGMFTAFFILLDYLPEELTFTNAVDIAGALGKMEVVDFSLDFDNRYTIWSGITGGLFLAMSYFGTDQSQVQRYLSGSSVKESRLGLLFNGLLKVPMQFFILFVGVMVFVFYQFVEPPAFFNSPARDKARQTEYKEELDVLEAKHSEVFQKKKAELDNLITAYNADNVVGSEKIEGKVKNYQHQLDELQTRYKSVVKEADETIETQDADYVFITFILNYLPHGIIGLLLAVILSAAMSSTAGELNALASTTIVDFYKRLYKKDGDDKHYVVMSRLFTLGWGILAICFAIFAQLVDNLIEAVNILGSIFYGTILGIFLVAFYIKFIKARAVFIAALISQGIVFLLYFMSDIGFLWYNAIGCIQVILMSLIFSFVLKNE